MSHRSAGVWQGGKTQAPARGRAVAGAGLERLDQVEVLVDVHLIGQVSVRVCPLERVPDAGDGLDDSTVGRANDLRLPGAHPGVRHLRRRTDRERDRVVREARLILRASCKEYLCATLAVGEG